MVCVRACMYVCVSVCVCMYNNYIVCVCVCVSVRAGLPAGQIEKGLEVTRTISTQANNAIHLSLVEGRHRNSKLGELVLQDLFLCQETHRQVYKERRVFLFERALLITKRRRKEEREVYAIKDQLMV